MKTSQILIALVITVLFIGCKPESLFFWGNYSKTLYSYKKDPNDKTLAEHKKSLNEIISQSTLKRKRIPPGVYAELGYILLKEGKEQEGMECMNKEITLFPESQIFIEKLRAEFQKGESK